MSISIINHQRLIDFLYGGADTDWLLDHLPRWMSIERLYSLLHDYRLGTLTDLEVAELDAVLEIVPALQFLYTENAQR